MILTSGISGIIWVGVVYDHIKAWGSMLKRPRKKTRHENYTMTHVQSYTTVHVAGTSTHMFMRVSISPSRYMYPQRGSTAHTYY